MYRQHRIIRHCLIVLLLIFVTLGAQAQNTQQQNIQQAKRLLLFFAEPLDKRFRLNYNVD